MSGPKHGCIRPNLLGQLRSVCAGANHSISQWGAPLIIEELEKQLKAARRQFGEADAAAEKLGGSSRARDLLASIDARRQDLVLLLKEEQRKLELAQATRHALERELVSGSSFAGNMRASESQLRAAIASLDRTRREADAANSAVRSIRLQFQNGFRELQLWHSEFGKILGGGTTSAPVQAPLESLSAIQARLAKEAELASLTEAVAKLESEPDGGWAELRPWLKSGETLDEFFKQLSFAKSQLAAGRLPAARSTVENVESLRAALIAEAAQNRQNAERTRKIADAIMQALCDRNYDLPKYGPLKDGDKLSGIQVRADVPNRDGRGNIRVDIHLDGRTDFEIENVVEGEEQLCRDVVGGLSEALADQGLELDITDWGRAKEKHQQPDAGVKFPTKTSVPELERERERFR